MRRPGTWNALHGTNGVARRWILRNRGTKLVSPSAHPLEARSRTHIRLMMSHPKAKAKMTPLVRSFDRSPPPRPVHFSDQPPECVAPFDSPAMLLLLYRKPLLVSLSIGSFVPFAEA